MLSWIPLQLVAKYWRPLSVALVATLLLVLIGRYVRRAETAKHDLEMVRLRAELAEGLIAGHQRRSDSLTTLLTSLRPKASAADSAYRRTKRTLGRRIIIADSFPMPIDTTTTSGTSTTFTLPSAPAGPRSGVR